MKIVTSGGGQSRSPFQTIIFLLMAIGLVGAINPLFPSLNLTVQNILFRVRGRILPPDEIVILAIDDASLQQIGSWPWPRSVMANVIDRLSALNPRAIGLDVIYAESVSPDDDRQLANSIAASGRVILPVQLYEVRHPSQPVRIEWLAPIQFFANSAAALGHVHVSPGIDGTVRSLQLSKADDHANRHWAFGVEVVRIADQLAPDTIIESSGWLHIGPYQIPIVSEWSGRLPAGVDRIPQNEIVINYAGPAGTFKTFSIADFLEGGVPEASLNGRIVLIGATAQSMGDSRVAPFMHYGSDSIQGGQQMAGVEIHANIINTIRGRLFLRAFPEWLAILLALSVMLLASTMILRLDGWRQVGGLSVLLVTILTGSYISFSSFRILPPLIQVLTAYAVIVPMLISRSLSVSRELDRKLAALAGSQKDILTESSTRLPDHSQGWNVGRLPKSFDWKIQTVDTLTSRILARMSFVNRILSSMGEGVIVTDLAGEIVFANKMAEQLLEVNEKRLTGQPLDKWLEGAGKVERTRLQSAMRKALDHQITDIEFTFPSPNPRYYSLSFSALMADDGKIDSVSPSGGVIGVVVLLSDVSKRVELDRIKTETLQLVSHELRTPLNSIQGLSDVLLKFRVAPEQSDELIATINSEARRLGETINSYLDLTRIESGAMSFNLAMVDAHQLIDGCFRHHTIPARQKGIRLGVEIDPGLPMLHLDAKLMEHALSNLIGNAIKYSPSGTSVTITATSSNDGAIILVSDEGYGIPEDSRERVFEKFYRLERDNSSDVIGSGLGLTMVREIVERHGGNVSIQSSPMGGSTFRVFIPTTVPRRHTRP